MIEKNGDVCKGVKLYTIGRNYSITTFKIFDVDSKRKDKIFIETPEPLDSGTSITLLPDSNLFCCGNASEEFRTVYIINPKNCTYTQFYHSHPCSKPGIVFHNGDIYAFGGSYIYDVSGFAAKFDLKRCKWATIREIPEASNDISCISYNKKIIFSGYRHSKVYGYDEYLNSYSEILQVKEHMIKILIIENSRMYVFEAEGRVFESNFNNPYIWNAIGTTNIFEEDRIVSIEFQTLGYVCLKTLSKNRQFHFCFGFNKEKKNLEKIAELND